MAARWLLLVLICVSYSPGDASHFRGAVIMFRTLDELTEELARDNGIRALIIYRIGWRRSYSIGTYCDQSTIDDGSKLLSEGRAALSCRTGCVGSLADMTFYCTDFSDTEDWSFGENTNEVLLAYAGDGIVQASFANSAWISLVRGGGAWEVRLSMNLTKIVTERGGNASPLSKMAPILRLQHGCNHTIEIPVEDADGDNIRCRWATSARSECGGVCQTFPGAELNERTCELYYAADRQAGYYAIALQIEDFVDQVETVPFSSVPLQFLVFVYTSTESCYSKPEFVSPPTRPDSSCIGVPANNTLVQKLVAIAGGPGISIVDIGTQSPPGLRKSSLDVNDENQWYVNITWTPTAQQYGPNIFCYVAKDSTQRTSDQVCVTILGGVTPPSVISGSQSPRGKIHPAHPNWQIEFDRDIFRPKRSAFIRFYDDVGREVYSVDTATSPSVTFPDPQVSNILEFQINFRFVEKAEYYVTLDDGVAIGKEFCGPESMNELSSQFWKLSIRDVTPPRITFDSHQVYTNANTTITWTFDEDAATACVWQSPGQEAFAVNCTNSFTGEHLAEGYHNSFIQASDNEGNSAQYKHRWYVDRTEPTVSIVNPPTAFSNNTEWTFHLRCNDRSSCVYRCKSHRVDQMQGYSDCNYLHKVDGLQEAEYVIYAYATDSVGNVGPEVTARWSVDTQAPRIQAVDNQTVKCGDPTTPTVLGYPEVTDNMDTNPVLIYTDTAESGCVTERMWVATDQAGNHASYIQIISFSNTVAPSVVGRSPLFVACGNTDDVLFNPEHIRAALNITHVCDREVNVTFVDSRLLDACGIDLTRSWTVTDDCGKTTLFNQVIKVLKQSFPKRPQNGEVNVDITSELVWPQYPGASQYNVYVWEQGKDEPTTPTSPGMSDRIYFPSVPYPPNTHMLWRIGYIIGSSDGSNSEVPSPNWGFITKSYPDLTVTDVQIPEDAFSGSFVTMSWRVENIGNVSTAASSSGWHDGIFLSLSPDVTPRRWTKTVYQRRFVDAKDGYLAEADVQLGDGEIGTFFVTVSTDIHRRVGDDFDRSNNLRQASMPLKVDLTPPPNLEVSSVFTLESSFSGQQTIIRWRVINSGIGITGSEKWSDAVFLSDDDELDSSDKLLQQVTHDGALISKASYEATAIVTIPNAIYGAFSIIVQTDNKRDVYEHANEKDNINSVDLNVLLSPTPDFVVQSLDAADFVSTGDVLSIAYAVKNNGAGSPFEGWWTDTVSLVSKDTGRVYYKAKRTYTLAMAPGASYTHAFMYAIPPNLPTGSYNITVLADDQNRIFEFNADSNNGKWKVISLQQALPNLEMTNSVSRVVENGTGSYLILSIIITNSGKGNIVGVSSEDYVFVSPVSLLSPGIIPPIITWARTNDLAKSETYTIEFPKGVEIPQIYVGRLYVYIQLDSNNLILESNENDNFFAIGTIEVSKRVADLIVSGAIVDTTEALAGNNLTLTWTVRNAGNLVTKSTRWVDSVYLSRDNSFTNSQLLHISDIHRSTPFQPNMEYSQSADIYLPIDTTESLQILVVTGQRQNGYEENQQNNIFSIDIEIQSPPTPDIVVQNVAHRFVAAPMKDVRILSVTYTVKNVGNTMQKSSSWTDRIRVRESGSSQVGGNMVQIDAEVSQMLVASGTYTVTKLISIPPRMFGYYELTVILDLFGDIEELYGENNNNWRLPGPILIEQIPLPVLSIAVDMTTIPEQSDSGDVVPVTYTVTNTKGSDLTLASWIDALYLYHSSGASRQQVLHSGLRVGHILQNQDLPIGDHYSSLVNTKIPYGIDGDYYIYVLLDVNNKLKISSETPFHFASPLNIQEGSLPDLVASLTLGQESMQSGQAVDIIIQVTNIGNSSTDGIWYDSLYLSEDTLVDPFDVTLKTVIRPRALNTNEHYVNDIEIFIPFDLAAPKYYIIVQSNFDQRLFEVDYDNNKAYHLVTIHSSPAVDLITQNVEPSSILVTYNDELTFAWDIVNNGSFPASGYKCDTVYLSDDPSWDITDQVVIGPDCDRFNLGAKDEPSDSQSYQTNALIPPLAEGTYSTIVRSRNNVHDYNTNNNIAISTKNITIAPPSIKMAETKTFQVTENSDLNLKVTDVPIGIALLVRFETIHTNAYHMLYLKQQEPPKQYDYDSASEERATTAQYVVVPVTKSGEYYLLLETIGFGIASYYVTIEVKEAKFEVTSVYPERATPSGTVTLRLGGMLFGHRLQACIQQGSTMSSRICADHIYRFGSNVVYSTFNVQDARTGGYSVFLEDLENGEVAEMLSSLFMIQDTPGKLAVDATMPGTLRAGREGLVRLNIQNIGYNDIETPILALRFTGDAASLRMADTDALIPPMSFYPFIPYMEGQPIAVIPPKANRQFQIYIKSSSVARESLSVGELGEAQLKGYISAMKHVLKPPTTTKKLWNRIWENVNYCLGTDMKSMNKRVRSILEVVNKRSTVRYGLVEVINQLALIADGRIAASSLFHYTDLLDMESSSARPLSFDRMYITALSVRQRKGPMGQGWIVPILEIRLLIRQSGDILLDKNRVIYLFEFKGNSYSSASLEDEIILANNEHYMYVTRDGLYYNFRKDTGRLISYGVIGTDESIQILYTSNRATALLDVTGSKITIEYNVQKLIRSVHLHSRVGIPFREAFYTYNSQNLLESIRIGTHVSKYEYNDQGDLSAVQYSSDQRQEITYDTSTGWLSRVSLHRNGNFIGSSDFMLECDGNLKVMTQPENVTSEFMFGFGGALVEHKSATGLSLSVKHDPVTKSDEVYVGDEVVAIRSYDATTNVYTQTDANGDVYMQYLNDDGDTLRASTSLGVLYENNITDGLLVSTMFPDGSTIKFEHNNKGRIKKRILRDSTEMLYEFNTEDNLVQKIGNRGSSFYIYDSDHKIIEMQDVDGTTHIEYDTNGLPTTLLYPDGTELIYTYNDKYKRTSLSTNGGYEVRYNYDNQDRLESVTDGAGKILSVFTYDNNGNLKKRTTGSGVYTNYTLQDRTLRLSYLEIYHADHSPISSFEYQHNAQGYLVSTETDDGTWKYKYDAAGQILTWNSPFGHGEDITYDANLNRATKKTKGRTSQIYQANKLGQITSFGKNVEFKFDKNGNMMEKINTQGNNEKKEIFSYDQDGHVTIVENKDVRCEYDHNSFGSISRKTCTDGTITHYVIDPFGPFGANVIAQSENGETSFIYHANELGLVAERDNSTGDLQYFLYDGDGSVVHTSDDAGSVVGDYTYDPFGVQITGSLNTNKFGYLGQLGIMKFGEAKNMYSMRARIYDAEHGRFISPDPLGPLGDSRNSYIYAKNNPLSYKDPTGEWIHIVGGTIIGGVTGALANAGSQALTIGLGGGSWSDFSWSDVGGATVGGAITGAAVTSGAILGGLGGAAVTAAGGFLGGASGSITSDALGGNSINFNDALTSGLINAPAALLPWKMLGYKGKGATSFGSKFMIPPKLKTVLDPRRATGKTLWKSLGAGSAVGELASKLGDLFSDPPSLDDIKDWGDDIKDWYDDLSDDLGDWWDDTKDDLGDWWDDFSDDLGDWWDDFSDDTGDWWDDFTDDLSDWGDEIGDWWQDWIRSKDPNDIIGPTGYGEGNFIAADINMDYKIRFENDENATAPAQKVTIRCPLDGDLDPSTFRLGSLGFGEFELKMDYNTPIFQRIVNVSEETGTFVYLQAGVDILNKEVYWLFQSIDPVTGRPPTDPTIGFLPPNNKSSGSGEGYVTFRIKQNENVLDGSRIDAQASIIFDENAPIETPPIFNTIDRTWPNVSVLIDSELADARGILVTFVTEDKGSGSKEVDIYTVSDMDQVVPLMTAINQSAVTLPVEAGMYHNIIVVAIDYVGNVKPLDAADYVEVFYQVQCPSNCSGNGKCQENGQCICVESFHGDDCSSNSSVIDPPVINAFAANGTEDNAVTLRLGARLVGTQSDEDSLMLRLDGYPRGSSFSKGNSDSGTLILLQSDFGDINMTPPKDISGAFEMTLMAILTQGDESVSRVGSLSLNIAPVTDIPLLTVNVGCFEKDKILSLTINASPSDLDGSEEVTVRVLNIPDFVLISGADINEGSTYLSPGEHTLDFTGSFEEFTLNITATASDTGALQERMVSELAIVEACDETSPANIICGAYSLITFVILSMLNEQFI